MLQNFLFNGILALSLSLCLDPGSLSTWETNSQSASISRSNNFTGLKMGVEGKAWNQKKRKFWRIQQVLQETGEMFGAKRIYSDPNWLPHSSHLFPRPVFKAQFSINIIVKGYLHYSKGLKLAFPPLLSTSHDPAWLIILLDCNILRESKEKCNQKTKWGVYIGMTSWMFTNAKAIFFLNFIVLYCWKHKVFLKFIWLQDRMSFKKWLSFKLLVLLANSFFSLSLFPLTFLRTNVAFHFTASPSQPQVSKNVQQLLRAQLLVLHTDTSEQRE